MRTDLPVLSRLTPEPVIEAPDGFQLFDSPIRGGLPHALQLFPRWRAVLSRPTGVARWWLSRGPLETVEHGAPRLRFQLDGVTACIIPLIAGEAFRITTPDGRTPLAVMVLDWKLHVGDFKGPGDYGSFVKLAVAVNDKAKMSFGPVPISDFVIPALPKQDRTESRPGNRIPLRYVRLQQLRMFSVERSRRRFL
jgi:hypothetical protein